jgi:hypothetical protein
MKNIVIVAIIIIAFFVVLTQRGCIGHSNSRQPDTLIVTDTFWTKHDSLIVKPVPVPYEVPVPFEVLSTEYKADTAYPKLKQQYEDLAKRFASRKIYTDSVHVGQYGHIRIVDTVTENKIVGRSFRENYKIPVVKETKTITKYDDPKRQVYVGGGLNLTSGGNVRSAEGGILYKTKKDQIYGAKVNIATDGTTSFGIQTYFKIGKN